VVVVRAGKNAGLAAILSFLWCGLGQIFNGQLDSRLRLARVAVECLELVRR